MAEVRSGCQSHLKLSADDLAETVKSGRKTKFEDRVAWALAYLRAGKLVTLQGRSQNRITPEGLEFLRTVNAKSMWTRLMELPDIQTFIGSARGVGTLGKPDVSTDPEVMLSPAERLDQAYNELATSLEQDLLERVKHTSPAFFERLVVQLMLRMGYGGPDAASGVVTGRTGDGGIDGVISEDRLGLERIYLQAKRYTEGSVGREAIQSFIGALVSQGARKGVFVTTSTFSGPAKECAANLKEHKVSLIDGIQLSKLLVDCGLGVSEVESYIIRRVDTDFFED